MKNHKIEALNSKSRFSNLQNEDPRFTGQYQNSDFLNLKRLSSLDFGHLKLFRVSILEIRICRRGGDI
jgi:hypothetical protein